MPIFNQNDREVVRILDNQGREIETIYDQNGVIVYTNAVEITGNAPLYFKGRGKPLKDWRLYGETIQDGTPSPDMPVDVVGCGVRTENLWDGTSATKKSINYAGAIIDSSSGYALNRIKIKPDTLYYVYSVDSEYANGFATYWQYLDSDNKIIGDVRYGRNMQRVELWRTPENAKYINICFQSAYNNDWDIRDFVIIEGSTPPDHYIPYGYKLPLTVNGTEYPIYLGQVPTTRRIKKFVFDGTETIVKYGQSLAFTFPQLPNCSSLYTWGSYPGLYCNILRSRTANAAYINTNEPGISIRNDEVQKMNIISLGYQIELADFKAYLAQQYTNGTPVTVWYVLAEPETGIVNEPLHRIGEYADTISFAQAGVTIPTVSGANVLDMTSAVKPSQMYIKGKIKPDGYGKLVDKNGVYILDKDDVSLTVHGQGTSN